MDEILSAIKEVSKQTGQPESICSRAYLAIGDVDKSVLLIEEAKKFPISIASTEQILEQMLIWCHNPILFEEVYLGNLRIIENNG
jgi:hypothetical protein